MTITLPARELAARLEETLPGSVISSDDTSLLLNAKALPGVTRFLKETPDLDFNYLNSITAVDYRDYFEVVYHLSSLTHNHILTLKVQVKDRKNPAVPSLTSLWRGAELQEREVYDLMGIAFEGHPQLKRIFLWEGFKGHPLRKDWKECFYSVDK